MLAMLKIARTRRRTQRPPFCRRAPAEKAEKVSEMARSSCISSPFWLCWSSALAALRPWSLELTRFALVPRSGFEQKGLLPDGAYKAPGMWFSRPGIANDPAQLRPQGHEGRGDRSRAVAFFVHPTSYLARGSLERIAGGRRRKPARRFVHPRHGQRLQWRRARWAPRYRQATFGAFLTDKPESAQALAVAYQDVKAAFASFLQQVPADAPIILAGHSQDRRIRSTCCATA
jgi:hypothetical protein